MRYENDRLSGDVHIDGNQFIGCTFEEGATLHFGGGDFVITGDTIFGQVDLNFHGAAINTLQFLKLLYGIGGIPMVTALLEAQSSPLPRNS